MAGFADLSAKLRLNISDFSSKLNSASAQARRFANDLRGKTGKSLDEVNKKTTAWGLNLKSISRVVSGILISQAFYKILQSIRNATGAVWEFTKELETAKVAYSNLFGDTELAEEFINVLKDFAARTPFSFTEAEKAAKRLLAYGIEYKNVMYVMQGVLSAASIQGDSSKIEAISRALGQIYTYGKLMTQEIRQLSEAGIPAYEILQEELGLTQEQLANLGNEGIKAEVAINALIDGIQKRFGSAAEAAAKTTSGIISNIKDNATMLFTTLFEPFTTFLKSGLSALGDFLFKLREIADTQGIGGVFEALVPERLQGTVRQFLANISALFQAVVRLIAAVGKALLPILEALVNVFNRLSPVVTTVINVFTILIRVISENAVLMRIIASLIAAAASAWVTYKLKALAATVVTTAVTTMSKAIAALSTVLTYVAAHPSWALLIGLGALLMGLSVGFDNIGNKVSSFFGKLTAFNGVDPDKILLPSQEERADDLDKFNNKLEGTSDAMDDLADSTGNATKAAKGLLSFDEVFKLHEPDEGVDAGITEGIEDILAGLEGLGDAYMPEIPDFSEYMDSFSNGFLGEYEKMWEGLKENLAAIAGGGIGYVIGNMLGGKLGGFVGMLAGSLVGDFWNNLADYFGLTPDQKTQAAVVGGVSAGLGYVFGGLLGGPLGAKLGAVAMGLVGSFWGLIAESLGVVPDQHIATAISGGLTMALQTGISFFSGAAKNLIPTYMDDVFIGFSSHAGYSLKAGLSGALKQGIKGAIVSLGVGALSNALTAWLANEFNLTEQDLENSAVGQSIGSLAGSIAGFFIGGPVGSLIGGAIGQFAGSLIGLIWDPMVQGLADIGVAIGNWCVDTWNAFAGWCVDVGTTIGNWCVDAWNAFAGWCVDVGTTIGNWCVDTWNAFTGWCSDTWGAFTGWCSDTWGAFTGWCSDTWDAVSGWCSDTWDAFTGWCSDTWGAFTGWCSGTWDAISSWCADTWDAFADWISGVSETIGDGLASMWDGITSWFSDLWDNIWGWLTDIGSGIADWWDGLWSDKSADISVNASGYSNQYGHATGGIFDREHVARFAEGNKAEAIIPLEEQSAMQPFVDAVANGLTASLAPIIANFNGSQQMQPLYVGTLIADEKSLRELERKMEIIRLQEKRR